MSGFMSSDTDTGASIGLSSSVAATEVAEAACAFRPIAMSHASHDWAAHQWRSRRRFSARWLSLPAVVALFFSKVSSAAGVNGALLAFAPPVPLRRRLANAINGRGRIGRPIKTMAYVDDSSGGGASSSIGKLGSGEENKRADASVEMSQIEAAESSADKENASPSINERRIDYTGAGTLGDIISADEDDDDEDEAEGAAIERSPANATTADRPATPTDLEHSAPSFQQHRKQRSPTKSGLVTSAGGTLQSRFSSKVGSRPLSPLDRIALTANGNLQRIFSSYYDAPVHVHVDRCELRCPGFDGAGTFEEPGCGGTEKGRINGHGRSGGGTVGPSPPATWDRTVRLSVHGHAFCIAASVITVRDPECVSLVHSGAVGIGQLFRHLDKLPTFELIDAGRRCSEGVELVEVKVGNVLDSAMFRNVGFGSGGGQDDGGLWRLYALRCDELECIIREDFSPDAWEIQPPELDHYEEHDNTF